MSKYQPVVIASIPSDIPATQHAEIFATINRLNSTLHPSYFTREDATRSAVNAIHGSGITACCYPSAREVKSRLTRSTNGVTYSVVVRNPNSWTQDEDGSNREYELTAHCGHKHQTLAAAVKCKDKLTAWYCNCGERSDSRRRCSSSTGHTANSTSARWYHATVDASDGSEIASYV